MKRCCVLSGNIKRNELPIKLRKNTAPSLDKDYAYLKSRSIEPSIAFTPSKARRTKCAELATHQVVVGKTRDAKKRISSFLLAHSKIVLQNRKNTAQ